MPVSVSAMTLRRNVSVAPIPTPSTPGATSTPMSTGAAFAVESQPDPGIEEGEGIAAIEDVDRRCPPRRSRGHRRRRCRPRSMRPAYRRSASIPTHGPWMPPSFGCARGSSRCLRCGPDRVMSGQVRAEGDRVGELAVERGGGEFDPVGSPGCDAFDVLDRGAQGAFVRRRRFAYRRSPELLSGASAVLLTVKFRAEALGRNREGENGDDGRRGRAAQLTHLTVNFFVAGDGSATRPVIRRGPGRRACRASASCRSSASGTS